MTTVVMAGALDTKGEEYRFAREQFGATATLLIDVGVGVGDNDARRRADISAAQVAARAETTLDAVRRLPSRAEALEVMARGLRDILIDLHRQGQADAVFGMGGSGALAVLSPGFRALPLGVPKVILTTMTAGGVAAADIVLIPAIVDIAGINSISRFVIPRAVATLKALLSVGAPTPNPNAVAASMFGVTTKSVMAAHDRLQSTGREVLVCHANGTGGRTLESVAADGWVCGVLDLTTTELADHLCGGIASAGPSRLTAAGTAGLPQVVSIGALDIVNFGALDAVPAHYRDRVLYRHSPTDTLMRTSAEECRALGDMLAGKLNRATGPVTVILPSGGLSALSAPGGPFHDSAADEALVATLVRSLRDDIPVVQSTEPANAPAFGIEAAGLLDRLLPQPGAS